MHLKLLLLVLLLFTASFAFSQEEEPAFLSKLEIPKGKTVWVGPNNLLLVDTLIMHDRSTLRFLSGDYTGAMEVKVAYIGNKVTIRSSADRNVGFGIRGGNLYLQMHFTTLGSLKIDTRGTRGYSGSRGSRGDNGTPNRVEQQVIYDSKGNKSTIDIPIPGTPATLPTADESGNRGGNGGDITLVYSTAGFLPNFGQEKAKHNIELYFEGGKSGRYLKINSPENETDAKPGTVKLVRVVD